jgi:hypothetical protein
MPVIPGEGDRYREADDERAYQDVSDQLGPVKVMSKQLLPVG